MPARCGARADKPEGMSLREVMANSGDNGTANNAGALRRASGDDAGARASIARQASAAT
jgi:hypothetical protein